MNTFQQCIEYSHGYSIYKRTSPLAPERQLSHLEFCIEVDKCLVKDEVKASRVKLGGPTAPKAFPKTKSSNLYLIKACNAFRHVFCHLKTKGRFLNSFRNCNFLHPKGTYVPILGTYCKIVKKLNYIQK